MISYVHNPHSPPQAFTYRSIFDGSLSKDSLLHMAPTCSLRLLAHDSHPPARCVYHACRVSSAGRVRPSMAEKHSAAA